MSLICGYAVVKYKIQKKTEGLYHIDARIRASVKKLDVPQSFHIPILLILFSNMLHPFPKL